jgi:hypothetical protein
LPVRAKKAAPIARTSSSVFRSWVIVPEVRSGMSSGSSRPPCGAEMMIGRFPGMYSMYWFRPNTGWPGVRGATDPSIDISAPRGSQSRFMIALGHPMLLRVPARTTGST